MAVSVIKVMYAKVNFGFHRHCKGLKKKVPPGRYKGNSKDYSGYFCFEK